jgi:hypothetical protein
MSYVATAEQGIAWALDCAGDVWILDTGDISEEDIPTNEEEGWTKVEDG